MISVLIEIFWKSYLDGDILTEKRSVKQQRFQDCVKKSSVFKNDEKLT